jgi:hypothetical protein
VLIEADERTGSWLLNERGTPIDLNLSLVWMQICDCHLILFSDPEEKVILKRSLSGLLQVSHCTYGVPEV